MQRIHDDKDINRLVIDSFNVFFASVAYPDALALNAEINVRKMIMEAFSAFRKNGLTTMLILETPQGNTKNFYYNIPHLVDGIISLEFLELGNIERRIFIPKMRWTDQYKENRQYEIGKKGIVVKE
jgi:KaiC/GvpD/RAD55 family RecA-like ATPase